jgi:hypothetical protein
LGRGRQRVTGYRRWPTGIGRHRLAEVWRIRNPSPDRRMWFAAARASGNAEVGIGRHPIAAAATLGWPSAYWRLGSCWRWHPRQSLIGSRWASGRRWKTAANDWRWCFRDAEAGIGDDESPQRRFAPAWINRLPMTGNPGMRRCAAQRRKPVIRSRGQNGSAWRFVAWVPAGIDGASADMPAAGKTVRRMQAAAVPIAGVRWPPAGTAIAGVCRAPAAAGSPESWIGRANVANIDVAGNKFQTHVFKWFPFRRDLTALLAGWLYLFSDKTIFTAQ